MDHAKSPDAYRSAEATYTYGNRRYHVQSVFDTTNTSMTELLLRLIVEDATEPKSKHDTQP